MKNLLSLCTKNVHFTFQNSIYQQKDGVAMGSPFGPVLAGTFMVHLERTLMPELEKFMKLEKFMIPSLILNQTSFRTSLIFSINFIKISNLHMKQKIMVRYHS